MKTLEIDTEALVERINTIEQNWSQYVEDSRNAKSEFDENIEKLAEKNKEVTVTCSELQWKLHMAETQAKSLQEQLFIKEFADGMADYKELNESGEVPAEEHTAFIQGFKDGCHNYGVGIAQEYAQLQGRIFEKQELLRKSVPRDLVESVQAMHAKAEMQANAVYARCSKVEEDVAKLRKKLEVEIERLHAARSSIADVALIHRQLETRCQDATMQLQEYEEDQAALELLIADNQELRTQNNKLKENLTILRRRYDEYSQAQHLPSPVRNHIGAKPFPSSPIVRARAVPQSTYTSPPSPPGMNGRAASCCSDVWVRNALGSTVDKNRLVVARQSQSFPPVQG